MKRERILSLISTTVLAFCLAFGGVACMITGLNLNCWPEDLAVPLLLLCLIFSFLLSLRRGGFVLLGLGAVAAIFAFFNYNFCQEALSMAAQIAQFYQKGYNLVLPESISQVTQHSHLMPALALAAVIAAVSCWAMLHRIPAILAVFLSAVPVGLCCVVTDTVPDGWCVLLWLGALALLLLTHPVRMQDGLQGAELTGILAIPVAFAVTILAILAPVGSYREPRFSFDSVLFVGKTFDGELIISYGSDLGDRVELDRLPVGDKGTSPVLEVKTDFSGTLYLRGQDHDVYDGMSWSATEDRSESDLLPKDTYTDADGTVTVRMLSAHSRFYLPYWPAQGVTLEGGALDNEQQLEEYSFVRMSLIENWHSRWTLNQKPVARPWDSMIGYSDVDPRYLELPEHTREQAWEILNEIFITGDVVDRAESIADYVRNSAEYDLNATPMPEDAEDFAIWFLTEADKGYCSHFATATTVLLRAAGIPARYVEGYVAEMRAGRPNIIREDKAHAWVEYYLDGLGWLPLESTPGYEEEEPVVVTDPTDETTTPTDPDETTRPTETTSPTETTQPTVTDPTETEPTHTEPSAEASSQPAQQGGVSEKPGMQWLGALLGWIGILAAVTAAVIGQWLLRRWHRLARQRRGKPNARALARFREAKRLARLSKLPLPEELLELVDKACFSQHQLTPQEIGVFDAYLRQAVAELRKAPLLKRLVYRLVFAAY